MKAEKRSRSEYSVALTSLFVGVFSLAISLRQSKASAAVVWAVIGLAFLLPVALGNFSLPRFLRRGPDPVLVASACRQVANSIDALWTERRNWAPNRSGLPGPSRQEWDLETKRIYDEGLRHWATEVFDEAVACGALAASSRALVQSPPPAQLHELGNLFRGAADTLEASAASRPS